MEFIDQLARTINLSQTPLRIVSLVPSQTELLVDLGLRDSIVGITKFCVHPDDLRSEKTIVGGTKNVNLDKIKALKPDIIICNKEENTEEMVLQLEKIAPVWISDISSISESIVMIEKLGDLFDVSEKAAKIVFQISSKLKEFKNYAEALPLKKVVYLIWKNPYMAAGKDTFIHELLTLNNFKNVIESESSRYPEVAKNTLSKADLILLSSEPYPFNEGHLAELQKGFKGKVKLVDGEYFSWYGSRLTEAFNYFKTLH